MTVLRVESPIPRRRPPVPQSLGLGGTRNSYGNPTRDRGTRRSRPSDSTTGCRTSWQRMASHPGCDSDTDVVGS